MITVNQEKLKSKKLLYKLFQVADCLFLIAISAVPITKGIMLIIEGPELGIRPEKIDPGVYMTAIWIVIVVFTAVEIFNRLISRDDISERVFSIATFKSFLLLFACVVTMPFLGFIVSIGLLSVLYLMWIARQRILGALMFTAVVIVMYYLIFIRMAGVVLPRGIVGF